MKWQTVLPKKAATDDIREIVYDKIPRETIITESKESGITKWQKQWTSSKKRAVSKLFLPHIKERISTPAEFTSIVTGHGFNRSYLNRFKIIHNSTCSCRLKEEETINHIILNCTQRENKRRILRFAIVRTVTPGPTV
jgi:hypothetical protein